MLFHKRKSNTFCSVAFISKRKFCWYTIVGKIHYLIQEAKILPYIIPLKKKKSYINDQFGSLDTLLILSDFLQLSVLLKLRYYRLTELYFSFLLQCNFYEIMNYPTVMREIHYYLCEHNVKYPCVKMQHKILKNHVLIYVI